MSSARKPKCDCATQPCRHITVDVCAFNDAAIYGRTKPRAFADFCAFLHDYPWNDGSYDEDAWKRMHAGYVQLFEGYLTDPDTQAFATARDARLRRQEEHPRRRAR